MRALQRLLGDRGTVLPLILILVQLVLLHAGAGALAAARMASVADAGWCIGADDHVPPDDAPAADCPCMAICAASGGGWTILPHAGVLVRASQGPAPSHRLAARPAPPRAPPPRAGRSRAPPFA